MNKTRQRSDFLADTIVFLALSRLGRKQLGFNVGNDTTLADNNVTEEFV